MAKKGLGRGFSSLIPTEMIIDEKIDSELGLEYNKSQLKELKISDISPDPEQPRRHFNKEKLEELVNSIRIHGVLQPIVVVRKNSKFLIVAGERRYRASKLAGLERVPAVIRELSDQNRLELSLIENIQRENLNPIEEAQGLKRLVDEFGLTHETVAEAVGRSRSAVSNSLRLLALPEPVQEMLFLRQLEMGHARALLPLPVMEQLSLAQKAVKNDWSVREVERRSQLAQQAPQEKKSKTVSPDIRYLNEALTEKLGVRAEVQTANHKRGKVVLHFDSPETFARLMRQLDVKLPD